MHWRSLMRKGLLIDALTIDDAKRSIDRCIDDRWCEKICWLMHWRSLMRKGLLIDALTIDDAKRSIDRCIDDRWCEKICWLMHWRSLMRKGLLIDALTRTRRYEPIDAYEYHWHVTGQPCKCSLRMLKLVICEAVTKGQFCSKTEQCCVQYTICRNLF